MAFWKRQIYEIREQALEAEQLGSLARTLLESPYLRQNVLNARFATTQGFSVIFRETRELIDQFPEFKGFLGLLSGRTNLYYLNVLAISAAGRVDRHVDHSIRGYDSSLPLPWRVSVLYVQVPPMEGGELLLFDRHDQIRTTIRPVSGMLVDIAGDCKHAVSELGQIESPRISLVCEQYQLSRKQLGHVPEFTVKSMAPFQAFLDRQL